MPPHCNRVNNEADPAFTIAVAQAVADLLPTLTARITDEIHQNENNGNNGTQRNARRVSTEGSRNDGDAQPTDIYVWLVTYKLEGDAHSWWRAYMQAKGGDAYVATLSWNDFRDIFFLVEFAYNNSWHASIKGAPFELLYGRKCRAPICWNIVGERVIEGPELVKMCSTFWFERKIKSAIHWSVRILDRIGEVTYRLALPPQLSHVHNAFYVSVLRGYNYHPYHVVQYPFDKIREDLSFAEEPEAILDRQERVMRKKTIPLVKVLWKSHPEREATWENEEMMRTDYPHLFSRFGIKDTLILGLKWSHVDCTKGNDLTWVKEGIVLGHKISKNRIDVDKEKVDVIAKLPHPTTIKGIQSFLGHTGSYCRFIQDFLKIARKMTRLLEKDTPFIFSKKCIEAFQSLKKKLTEAPILVAPDWDLPFELMCD
nr:reverse transcriptase domain-containing protein [Tanacetum cinerariifolium]